MAHRKSQPKKRRIVHERNITAHGVLKAEPNYRKLARAVLEIAREDQLKQ